jgi:hypothetical protein
MAASEESSNNDQQIDELPTVNLIEEFRSSRRYRTLERIKFGYSIAGRPTTRRSVHEQLVHGRAIVLAKDIGLYLTWREDTIFIKPLPAGLTANVVTNLSQPPNKDDHVCGFLHSYVDLIKDPNGLANGSQTEAHAVEAFL